MLQRAFRQRSAQDPTKEQPQDEQALAEVAPSNAQLGAELEAAPAGPFDTPVLDAALALAFGDDLGGLSVDWSADEDNEDIAATASTSGTDIALGRHLVGDLGDADAMAVVAEETAHALAGGGSGDTLVDGPQDPGESRARDAGARFGRWMAGGLEGAAPSLSPATGGQARTHRSGTAVLTGVPSLRMGSQGSSVTLCQQLLNEHGEGIAVDGDFGPQTDGAVRHFQTAHGLIVDGVVGPQTAGALNRTPSASSGPTASVVSGSPPLRMGSQGSEVRALQTALTDEGFRCVVDGDFGPQTDGQVRAYQSSRGLVVDGVVGPQTAGSLNGASSSAPAPGPGPAPAPAVLTGSPPLRQGSEGEQVRLLQIELGEAGFPCVVDGDFGSQTDRTVRSYQSSRGLVVDGVVGPQTANALTSDAPAVATVPTQPGAASPTDYDPGNRLAHGDNAPGNRRRAIQTAERITAAGYHPYIVSVVRTFSEQDAMYEQGRSRPGGIVTGVRGGGSWHNYGCAVDFAFWNDAHTGPSWDGHHPWHLIGQHGRDVGYTRWGGDWGDRPHLELHPTYGSSCYDLESMATSQGMPAVWSRVGAL